MVPVRATCRGT